MANVKVKNVSNTTVIAMNDKGEEIILHPGETGEINKVIVPVFSGKLIPVIDKPKPKPSTTNASITQSDEKPKPQPRR